MKHEWLVRISTLISLLVPANAAGSSCTQASRTHFGFTVTFEFNCGGAACACGTFVNGDWWVAPEENLTLTAVSPLGEEHGLELNPTDGYTQGILSGYSNYDSSRNLMLNLPLDIGPGSSLVKMVRRSDPSICGTSAIRTFGCAEIYEVLTVLGSPLDTSSDQFFRPAFATNATFKGHPISVSALSLWRMPNTSLVDDTFIDFGECSNVWRVPQYDNMHLAAVSEQMRATAPAAALPDYAADQAVLFLNDLLSTFGAKNTPSKKACIYALVQRGVDIFGAYETGIRFGSGAGQHLGRQPPVVFYAALINNPNVLDSVRKISLSDEEVFQESTQIRRSRGGFVLWGDTDPVSPFCNGQADPMDTSDPSDNYWSQVFDEYFARYYGGSGFDNKGTRCDPHGYIDGPAGLNPSLSLGRSYIGCCSMGPLAAYWAAQRIMPAMAFAHNDNGTLDDFVQSHYLGKNSSDGKHYGQYLTLPDPCAPPDPRENANLCKPYKARTTEGCSFYRVTWGPIEGDPANCIPYSGNSTPGRWPIRHEEKFEISRLPVLFEALSFDDFLACSDPAAAAPCDGLGMSYAWSNAPSAAPSPLPSQSDVIRLQCSVVFMALSNVASDAHKIAFQAAISSVLDVRLSNIQNFDFVTSSMGRRRLHSGMYEWTATFDLTASLSEVGVLDAPSLATSVVGMLTYTLTGVFSTDPILSSIGLSGTFQVEAIEGGIPTSMPVKAGANDEGGSLASATSLAIGLGASVLFLFLFLAFLYCKQRAGLSTEQIARLEAHNFESLDALLDYVDEQRGIPEATKSKGGKFSSPSLKPRQFGDPSGKLGVSF